MHYPKTKKLRLKIEINIQTTCVLSFWNKYDVKGSHQLMNLLILIISSQCQYHFDYLNRQKRVVGLFTGCLMLKDHTLNGIQEVFFHLVGRISLT